MLYVNDQAPGIRRSRCGRGFVYRLPSGARVTAASTLQRIRALAIPPAYQEVWICRNSRGHLQATGRDSRGRKQYRYHPDWKLVRDADKFERLIAFGAALPRLRRKLKEDLRRPGLPADKVLAVAVSILLETFVRVGNGAYARSNGSYGLTTLRRRHVDFLRAGRARLVFRGKGGRRVVLKLDNPRLVRLMRACQELPGQRLFQYLDDDGRVRPIDSGAINDYLRHAMGEAFTAKAFRTWGGTLQAFKFLVDTPAPSRGSKRFSAKVRKAAAQEVAGMLGNTPAVCLKSYIDPRLFSGWEKGGLTVPQRGTRGEARWERALLRFLRAAGRG